MDPQRHLIRTQAIQVGMTRPESAQAILDLTGTLWRTRLEADADEIFSASCQPHEHVQLERLEIALGTIPEEDFAREFPLRFRARLGEELRRQLRRLRDGETGAGRLVPGGRSPLELLEHLLLHGLLPWWSSPEADFDPGQALVAALAQAPRAAAALVRRIGRHRRVRLRLVQWLDDPALAVLIRAVAPGEAEFVLRYAADLDTRQEEKRFVPAGAAEFRQAKWEIILAHLLADRGSRFNAKAFLAQTLRELAGRFRVEYAALLTELARVAANMRRAWRETSLPQLLGELYAEELQGAGSVTTWQAVWSDALREPPVPGQAPHRTALAFWRELSAKDARALIRELVARHGVEVLVNFLADGFPATDQAELLGLLRTPVPGEPADEGRKIQWLAETLAGIVAARAQTVADRAARPAVEVADDLALPALRVLLETGLLPAAPWAQRWRDRPGAWLNLMLARHAEAVPPLLRVWAQAGRLAAAMAARLPDSALAAIVETLEPAGAEEAIAVVQITLRAKPVAPGRSPPAAAWRELTWRVVLDYLLLDRGSVFNTRSFLAHNVNQLAVRHRVDIQQVWASLVVVAERDGQHALWSDLMAIRPAGPAATPGKEETSPRALFSEQSLRRSTLARLRLLQLVLAGSPQVSEAWLQALLPLLWELLAAGDEAVEFMRRTREEPGATDLILKTGGTEFLTELFFAREPAQAALWRDAVSWLESSPVAATLFPGGRAGLRHRLWRALAELWREAGGQPVRDVADFIARILGRLGVRAAGRSGGWRESAQATGLTPAQGLQEILRAALAQDGTREAAELARRLPGRPLRRPAPDAEKETSREEAEEKAENEKEEAATRRDEDRMAPIAVSNAGLVLLLPFFPELHKRCGWLDDGRFRDYEATQRAVHLLQYLVNGGTRTHEYSLALNKVLCGLEPEAAVISRVKLTDPETAAAQALLENVTSRWARGAAISVEGLRASYLRRPGWLRRTAEGGWSLRVETRGWDVLLSDLPWRFPGTRPAWMPRPLEVDWI